MPIDTEIIRSSRRKHIAIRVLEGRVQLLLPKRASENEAHNFLRQHQSWVDTQLRKQSIAPAYQPKQFIEGEKFAFLGTHYFLNIAYAKTRTLMVRENQLFVFIASSASVEKNKQHIHKQLRNWYYQQAERVLQEKTIYYAQFMQLSYRSVSIRQFKSRWGSCSNKGDIQYNWQIMLAPHEVVDYLVVHELAHLKHHNHSKRFWNLVASVLPDYKTHKGWLKTYGHQLKID